MAPDHNPFLRYLETHPGADAVALKQLFRLLAKRTHPDLGAENEAAFVDLQDSYNAAVEFLLRRSEEAPAGPAAGSGTATEKGVWFPATPRERVLHFLYRYKAHLPSMTLEFAGLPSACLRAYARAVEASHDYTDDCRYTLVQFGEQFHNHRAEIVRYPEVTTKYRPIIQALASFFDFCHTANTFNARLVSSYLNEIHPVTNFNPEAGPEVRTNRSAAARAAMYRMRTWLESEVKAGPCRVL